MEFSIGSGTLAEQSVDALIYGAGTGLEMDGDVGRSLRRAASEPLAETASSDGSIGLGQVAVSDASELDARYVIHAAAIPDHGNGEPSAASVRAAMRNALHRADALDCESIATTVLGANTATYDHRKGARIVCETIDGYDPTAIEECRIVASGSPEYDRLSLLADEVLSVPDY